MRDVVFAARLALHQVIQGQSVVRAALVAARWGMTAFWQRTHERFSSIAFIRSGGDYKGRRIAVSRRITVGGMTCKVNVSPFCHNAAVAVSKLIFTPAGCTVESALRTHKNGDS